MILLMATLALPSDLPAKYSELREQLGPKVVLASYDEERTLLDLLRDPDVSVRREAVRSLKTYVISRSSTRDRVVDVLRDGSEDLSVRRQAAKTLSAASHDNGVQRVLLETAQRGDAGLRDIAYKALHWAAASRSDVRDELLDEARRGSDPRVRRAAIWGLFQSSNDGRVQDGLIDLARRDRDDGVRDEALRSLYYGMGSPDVRRLSADIARDSSEPTELRVSAVLLNSFRVESSQTDLLERLAERDPDPVVRTAAVTALGRDPEAVAARFHLIRRNRNGGIVSDPLDAE